MEKIWLKHYPGGVPAEVRTDLYPSLLALLEAAFRKHAALPAYKFMGRSYSYAEIDAQARALAAYLQGLGLERGDRVAIMLPNVPQYPVAVAAILRAGYVVVNVNPLYTPRELEHQLKDSGARAIVVLENFAATLQQVLDNVPTKQVILAAMGDMLGSVQRALVNHVVRKTQEAGAALPAARRGALQRGAGAGPWPQLQLAAARARGHRLAAVHRRHHRRQQGRGAAASQPGGQRAAGRGLEPARAGETSARRAADHRVRAAAASHLRLHREHDAGHAPGRLQPADSERARHRRRSERAVQASLPQLPGGEHDVRRAGCSTRPSTPSTGVT